MKALKAGARRLCWIHREDVTQLEQAEREIILAAEFGTKAEELNLRRTRKEDIAVIMGGDR